MNSLKSHLRSDHLVFLMPQLSANSFLWPFPGSSGKGASLPVFSLWGGSPALHTEWLSSPAPIQMLIKCITHPPEHQQLWAHQDAYKFFPCWRWYSPSPQLSGAFQRTCQCRRQVAQLWGQHQCTLFKDDVRKASNRVLLYHNQDTTSVCLSAPCCLLWNQNIKI